MDNYIINFTGTLDLTSTKPAFSISAFTTNGPATPHSLLFEPRAVVANTTLVLPGKGVTDYGTILAENQVHLLENFAASIPPVYPTSGQLWFDTASNTMKVWNGTLWEPIQITNGTVPPTSPLVGTLWFDTASNIFKYWSGTSWDTLIPTLTGIVLKSGDTMTGPLILSGNPTANLGAATKQYVDTSDLLLQFNIDNSVSKITGGNIVGDVFVDEFTSTFPVLSSSSSPLNQIVISGNHVANLTTNRRITIAGSGGNDGNYTVLSSSFSAGNTTIITNENIPVTLGITGTLTLHTTFTFSNNSLIQLLGTSKITIQSPPVFAADVPNKAYVDAIAGGSATFALLTDVFITPGLLDQDIIQYDAGTNKYSNVPIGALSNIAPYTHVTSSSAHLAADIVNVPTGTLTSGSVQAALNELDTFKLSVLGGTMGGTLDMSNSALINLTTPINNRDATTKQYVDVSDTIQRQIFTVVGGETSLNTNAYYIANNKIEVFVNTGTGGTKLFNATFGQQSISVSRTIVDNSVLTGLMPLTMYLGQLISSTSHQIVAADSTLDTFTVSGRYDNWLTATQSFTVVGGPNAGSYTVLAAGSTYNPVNDTTIIPVATVPSTSTVGLLNVTDKIRPLSIKGEQAESYEQLINSLKIGITEPLVSATSGTNQFVIVGDYTSIAIANAMLTISDAGANDGIYKITSSSFGGGNTTIVVSSSVAVSNSSIGTLTMNQVQELTSSISGRDLALKSTTIGINSVPRLSQPCLVRSTATTLPTSAPGTTITVDSIVVSNTQQVLFSALTVNPNVYRYNQATGTFIQDYTIPPTTGKIVYIRSGTSTGNNYLFNGTTWVLNSTAPNIFGLLSSFFRTSTPIAGDVGDFYEDLSTVNTYVNGTQKVSTALIFNTPLSAGTVEVTIYGIPN